MANFCQCGCGRQIPDFGVARPIRPRRWFNNHSPRKRPGPVFSPLEKKIRNLLTTRRYQKRNPEKLRAQHRRRYVRCRETMLAQNRAWWKSHPEAKRRQSRQMVRKLPEYYLRALLRFHGITNPTPEDYEAQRKRCVDRRRKSAVLRSSQALAMLSVCASLTKR